MIDAFDRAKMEGITVSYNKIARQLWISVCTQQRLSVALVAEGLCAIKSIQLQLRFIAILLDVLEDLGAAFKHLRVLFSWRRQWQKMITM